MTLLLSESQVEGLLDMKEVVGAVEEAFRREAAGEAVNSPRTRSRGPGAALNVMHASLPYLGRGGVKCYMSSAKATKFMFLLFDMNDSKPLAVMGADLLGRYRTGAASGVATKFLYGRRSGTLAVCGSGRQALTQVLAVAAVIDIGEVRVWSPDHARRQSFAEKLKSMGFSSSAFETATLALGGADVACTITSAAKPFVTAEAVSRLSHLNVCGGNNPEHSEISAEAVGSFSTVAVDDLPQAMIEYGDLIQAAAAGTFSWGSAVELKDVVAGRRKPGRKTLYKSGGAALEDVATASLLYDKALKLGRFTESNFDFV
ncbi:MAG: ornithine cyclodeaminase family protein [Thaumarchaeota archaeon]|nr:ornithine cyclodeaminase family protein [Nitrososphaerota archaeon]